jgi:formylglycine-generating enzyme required for sulfatase activity
VNEPRESPDPLPLPPELDSVCDRFEAAWEQAGERGPAPEIEPFLGESTGGGRVALLHELVALDVAYRRRRGVVPALEEYAARFADLDRGRLQRDLDQASGAAAPTCEVPTTPQQATEEAFTPDFRVPGYEIRGEIGRGGMGVVYRARQLSLPRDVALKRLPPALAADPHRLGRFRTEARAAAQLTDAGIVPVFDVVELAEGPVLVMPYIEGRDLGRILADRRAVRAGGASANRHPWAALSDREYLDRVLPVLDHVLEAVTVIHRAEILHRDIKPSNILVQNDGHVWLTDFGLARLGTEAGITSPGMGMGTPGFMSPEQWDGLEDVDCRTDVFGLGATIYLALTLELPYGKARPGSSSSPLVPPSGRQPLLTRDFDAVVLKALEPERAGRYTTARELQEDWSLLRAGLLPRARRSGWAGRAGRQLRRHRGTAAALLLAALALGLSGMALLSGRNRPGALPEDTTDYRKVRVVTKPAGARVVLVPLDSTTGELQPARALRPAEKTPLTLPRVPVGEYLVVAEVKGHGFHEVHREAPAPDSLTGRPDAPHLSRVSLPDGTIEWVTIMIPPLEIAKGMVYFPGGEFTMGSETVPLVPVHQRTIPAFYLDPTEVTVGEFKKIRGVLPERLRDNPPPDTHAISYVTFDRAMEYAEKVGKRLPDEAEYEFAATEGGTRDYPRDIQAVPVLSWSFGPVGPAGQGGALNRSEVSGLFGNVAEWTTSWNYPYPNSSPFAFAHRQSREMRDRFGEDRVVRGGPYSVVMGRPDPKELARGPRWRHGIRRGDALPGLGFRCARSARPRFLDR